MNKFTSDLNQLPDSHRVTRNMNLKLLKGLQKIWSEKDLLSDTSNLDFKTMRLHVQLGKGAKERYTKLSEIALQTLRTYWRQNRPRYFLFPGQKPYQPIHSRSIALVFKKALINTGIPKPATVHTLRHSFASHLLDQGEKLPTIQKLLGHSSLRSTVIYLHVSTITLDKLISPLDSGEFI